MSGQEQEQEELETIPHDQGTAEDQAARLGWVPQDQYKGKRPWVDAAEYLERLREDSPRLRHVNDRLARELEEVKNTNREILAHHERQIKQERQDAYDRATADLEAKLVQATAAGDVSGATAILKRQQALDAQIASPGPVTPTKRIVSEADKELVSSFKEENSDWFEVDPEMTKYAQEYETALMNKGVSLAQRLKMTVEKVQRRFPQEFQSMNNDALDNEPLVTPRAVPPRQAIPNRSNSSSVRRVSPRVEPGSYEALSPKGKSACDSHLKAFPEAKKALAKSVWLKFARNDASLFN